MTITAQPDVPDVPDISAQWYQDTVEFAQSTPGWVHTAVEVFTDGGVIVLFVFMALAAWRARRRPASNMAAALLTPVAAALAYGISEFAKSLIEEHRPCRALDVDPVVRCPPVGDWSFPSNHTTAAVAIAVGLVLTWRWLGVVSLLLAAGVAYSRIFLGAHYPHDVAAGAVLGAAVTLLLLVLLTRPVAALVSRLRHYRVTGPLLGDNRSRGKLEQGGADAPTEVFRSPVASFQRETDRGGHR